MYRWRIQREEEKENKRSRERINTDTVREYKRRSKEKKQRYILKWGIKRKQWKENK